MIACIDDGRVDKLRYPFPQEFSPWRTLLTVLGLKRQRGKEIDPRSCTWDLNSCPRTSQKELEE